MNKFYNVLAILAMAGMSNSLLAQTPGGVDTSLTAWFQAEAGATLSPTNVLTLWTNQVTNPNLPSLSPDAGATTRVNNDPVPFNFHSYMQHASGCMHRPTSVTSTDIVAANQGSMMGIGTEADQLIALTGNSTSGQFGNNRANTGIRSNRTEFGSGTTNGGANFATGIQVNPGRANLFGLRGLVGGSPAQQNTYNGLKATGAAANRPSGSYRFAIGSFIGYYYGNGKSAEVICYSRQLTANEFSRVESYLAIKYGITLGNPASPVDYLSSASALIWPADAAYQYNITGIGRDDSSKLIQKQSKAVTTGAKIVMYNGNTAGSFPNMNADNASVFTADLSFVVFGDNNGSTALDSCALNGKAVCTARRWKMIKTGAAGDVTIAFNAADLPADITTLLVSADNSFPESATTAFPLSNSGTIRYAVIPSANTFFTFSAPPLNVTVTVDPITCSSSGERGTMSANVSGGLAPVSLSWNTNPPQTTPVAQDVPAGSYTLKVTQAAGCTYVQDVTVNDERIKLSAQLLATDIKCYGANNGSITVNVTNGTPPYAFCLNTSNAWTTNNQFTNLSEGFYTIHFKDANGCTGEDTVTIYEPKPLSLKIDQVTDDYCERGSSPNGSARIRIQGGTSPYATTLNGTGITPADQLQGLNAGDYGYTVTDARGCSRSDSFQIRHIDCCLLFLPNAFTPNMDGKNDIFKVETTGPITLDKLRIYNRYGQMVFQSFHLSKGWDGTKNGVAVDPGTYFYTLQYTCKSLSGPQTTTQSGDLTLIR
ncbi:gliding motility-associated C-terminal domain-containing protein [Taibaiella chishuiensis]|uniref:Gliding motility-associated-like protein n=1 Tax=Taibaiella chishuiensis TaxID=1434707 RepID=A0A2P8DAC0_9BACT|nr:gliding motility-associated C-terminal domain-containing protein [Taibaiella chishuiensis]PSK94174.1 gliding motility-associated-like protein [Taibaiella chishuiensis]